MGVIVFILSLMDGGDVFWNGLLTWSKFVEGGDGGKWLSARRGGRAGLPFLLLAVRFGLAQVSLFFLIGLPQLSTVVLLRNVWLCFFA